MTWGEAASKQLGEATRGEQLLKETQFMSLYSLAIVSHRDSFCVCPKVTGYWLVRVIFQNFPALHPAHSSEYGHTKPVEARIGL